MKCLTDLDSFFWIGNMFVTQVLEWNEPRDSVVQSCPNTDRLARTPASVKVTPHLHSTAPSTSSQCYSLTTQTGNAFLSANHTDNGLAVNQREADHLAELREVFLITERTLPQAGLITADRVGYLQLVLVWSSMSDASHMADYQLTCTRQPDRPTGDRHTCSGRGSQ